MFVCIRVSGPHPFLADPDPDPGVLKTDVDQDPDTDSDPRPEFIRVKKYLKNFMHFFQAFIQI